jgi:hypothetical protein
MDAARQARRVVSERDAMEREGFESIAIKGPLSREHGCCITLRSLARRAIAVKRNAYRPFATSQRMK